MIVFVSSGLAGKPPIGFQGVHLTAEEARDLRDCLTDALNHIDETDPVLLYYAYGDIYGREDTEDYREGTIVVEKFVPRSPFPELEE